MSDGFSITQRHYDIIIEQAQVNYPQECGGFLGGTDRDIKAILPVFNQHLFVKTDTYAVTQDDVMRAHEFFDKHSLSYFGMYHTHPKGSAIPSKQDLSHIQNYMFIISLRIRDNPDFAAFVITGKNYKRVPLNILTGPIKVVDIHEGSPQPIPTPGKRGDLIDEVHHLNSLYRAIARNEAKYPKLAPKKGDDQSAFSTFA